MAPTSQPSTPLSGGAVRNATRACASEAPMLQVTDLEFHDSAEARMIFLKLQQCNNNNNNNRVKLGLCASVLALSSIDVWVSCNEEVP